MHPWLSGDVKLRIASAADVWFTLADLAEEPPLSHEDVAAFRRVAGKPQLLSLVESITGSSHVPTWETPVFNDRLAGPRVPWHPAVSVPARRASRPEHGAASADAQRPAAATRSTCTSATFAVRLQACWRVPLACSSATAAEPSPAESPLGGAELLSADLRRGGGHVDCLYDESLTPPPLTTEQVGPSAVSSRPLQSGYASVQDFRKLRYVVASRTTHVRCASVLDFATPALHAANPQARP